MIITEYSIKSIVETIPAVVLNPTVTLTPRFHWGDEKELNRYIQMKKEDSYPLIWLLPSPDIYIGGRLQFVSKECSFVIATRETRTDLFNDQRYTKTFEHVLNPLVNNLVYGLSKSSISEIDGENTLSIYKHPNYSAESEENGTIDVWDAIKLEVKIKFRENCLKPISYG